MSVIKKQLTNRIQMIKRPKVKAKYSFFMEELRGFLHGNNHWTKNGSEEHDNFLNLKAVYLKPGCFLSRSGQAGSAHS